MLKTMGRFVLAAAVIAMLCPYVAEADVTHAGVYNVGGTTSQIIYQNFSTESQLVFVTACGTSGPVAQLVSAIALLVPIGTLGCRGLSVELVPTSDIAIFNPAGPPAVGSYQISIIRRGKK